MGYTTKLYTHIWLYGNFYSTFHFGYFHQKIRSGYLFHFHFSKKRGKESSAKKNRITHRKRIHRSFIYSISVHDDINKKPTLFDSLNNICTHIFYINWDSSFGQRIFTGITGHFPTTFLHLATHVPKKEKKKKHSRKVLSVALRILTGIQQRWKQQGWERSQQLLLSKWLFQCRWKLEEINFILKLFRLLFFWYFYLEFECEDNLKGRIWELTYYGN